MARNTVYLLFINKYISGRGVGGRDSCEVVVVMASMAVMVVHPRGWWGGIGLVVMVVVVVQPRV
jgi:hypothetical protein